MARKPAAKATSTKQPAKPTQRTRAVPSRAKKTEKPTENVKESAPIVVEDPNPNSLSIVPTTSSALTLEPIVEGELDSKAQFYANLSSDVRKELTEYTHQIRTVIAQTFERVMELGAYFSSVRQMLPTGTWTAWLELEFSTPPLKIHRETIIHWMNLYKKATENPQARQALSMMALNAAYEVCSGNLDAPVQERILTMAIEGSKLTDVDIRNIKRLNRQLKIAEYEILPELQVRLAGTAIDDEPKFLERINKLSATKQKEMAAALVETEDYRTAYRQVIDTRSSLATITVDYTSTGTPPFIEDNFVCRYADHWTKVLEDLPAEMFDLVIAECPLRYDWRDGPEGLDRAVSLIARVLRPGGFLITTLGHKAIMGCESHIKPYLSPLHVLTLRKQPGRTPPIVGINIGAASLLCALAYKPPFRKPPHMVIDLQTIDEFDEVLPGLDEVESGLEKCFRRFIENFVPTDGVCAHVICGKKSEQFGIRESLIEAARNLAGQFHAIG